MTRMHSSRMPTTRFSPYGGGLLDRYRLDRDPYLDRDPPDRDPAGQRPHLDRDPPDRDPTWTETPPRQRPPPPDSDPWTETSWTETPGQKPPGQRPLDRDLLHSDPLDRDLLDRDPHKELGTRDRDAQEGTGDQAARLEVTICRDLPSAELHASENILPCPKLRLRAVSMIKLIKD